VFFSDVLAEGGKTGQRGHHRLWRRKTGHRSDSRPQRQAYREGHRTRTQIEAVFVAQFAGGTAPAEHTRVLQRDRFQAITVGWFWVIAEG